MKWALVDGGGIVVNVIVHEEGSGYSAPEAFKLMQVNDWIDIGHNIDTPQPSQE